MSSNNGSYQKYDGTSGTYQEINSTSAPKKRGLWIVGIVLAAALGVGYTYTQRYHQTGTVVSKALASSSSGVTVDKEGKLKLFDELSK
jgi:hypothetical protein